MCGAASCTHPRDPRRECFCPAQHPPTQDDHPVIINCRKKLGQRHSSVHRPIQILFLLFLREEKYDKKPHGRPPHGENSTKTPWKGDLHFFTDMGKYAKPIPTMRENVQNPPNIRSVEKVTPMGTEKTTVCRLGQVKPCL